MAGPKTPTRFGSKRCPDMLQHGPVVEMTMLFSHKAGPLLMIVGRGAQNVATSRNQTSLILAVGLCFAACATPVGVLVPVSANGSVGSRVDMLVATTRERGNPL